MRIIAHRGDSACFPENSLPALDSAIRKSADGAEIDLRLSRDHQVMLLHDESLARTCGDPRLLNRVDAHELSIPRLGDVLQRWPIGKRLFLELKEGSELAVILAATLDSHRDKDLQLLCFDRVTLRACERRCEWVPRHLNIEWNGDSDPIKWGRERVDECHAEGWSGISIGAQSGWDASWPMSLHRAGLNCAVWTIDDPDRARMFQRDAVDDLMTNDPQRIRRALS